MTDLLIKNAHVVTCDAAGTTFADGGVTIRNGKIAFVGAAAGLAKHERNAARVLDASGHILMPGLVNTHCHAGDSLFRGLVEDLPLETWLQTVWQAEGAILDPETTCLGAV
ncbi:MAG: amidohydrolase, partial [Paracoccaceae bacterium]